MPSMEIIVAIAVAQVECWLATIDKTGAKRIGDHIGNQVAKAVEIIHQREYNLSGDREWPDGVYAGVRGRGDH